MSQKATGFLDKILKKNPAKRLGAKGIEEIKSDPFFNGIDWEALMRKDIKPTIKLSVEDSDDEGEDEESKFLAKAPKRQAKVLFRDKDYNTMNKNLARVEKFTFVRK